jgi:hypothetical protein
MESLTLSLPAHWIAPVLYGDTSDLNETETDAFRRWLVDTIKDVGHGAVPLIGCINDNTYFARYHDAAEYGVLACDCLDVEMLVPVAGTVPVAAPGAGLTPYQVAMLARGMLCFPRPRERQMLVPVALTIS